MFMMSFTNVNAVRYETATPTALTQNYFFEDDIVYPYGYVHVKMTIQYNYTTKNTILYAFTYSQYVEPQWMLSCRVNSVTPEPALGKVINGDSMKVHVKYANLVTGVSGTETKKFKLSNFEQI